MQADIRSKILFLARATSQKGEAYMADSEFRGSNNSDAMESEEQWKSFVQGLASGSIDAQETFWSRYGAKLDAVTRRKFPPSLNRRIAPEDIVQSTCRSFFARVQDGRLEVSDRDQLWGLLCAIALNKTRMKQRYHLAQRRDLKREQEVIPGDPHEERPALEIAGSTPPPDEAVIFSEQLQRVMELLDGTEQQILQLKLENYTNQEIADRVNRSERTVRRAMERLQEKLADAFRDAASSP